MENNMKKPIEERIKPVHIIIFSALTIAIMAVMNLYLITKITIEAKFYGCTILDMNPLGYSREYVERLLMVLTEDKLNLYKIQLILDMFYPLAYGGMFFTIFLKLSGKTTFLALPALLMAADYTENILSFVILSRKNEVSDMVINIASTATVIKTVIMYASAAAALVLLIIWIVKRVKKS